MDQAAGLDGYHSTPRRQEDQDSHTSETGTGAQLTDTLALTPDQINMIQYPPSRPGAEVEWPASPRLTTRELQPDDAESSQNVEPLVENHSIAESFMLQLSGGHSLLLHPQVPSLLQEQTGWGTDIYQPEEAFQSGTSILAPLTEIDEALADRPFRGFEERRDSDGFIVVFADSTWVLVFVWLIDTSTVATIFH